MKANIVRIEHSDSVDALPETWKRHKVPSGAVLIEVPQPTIIIFKYEEKPPRSILVSDSHRREATLVDITNRREPLSRWYDLPDGKSIAAYLEERQILVFDKRRGKIRWNY